MRISKMKIRPCRNKKTHIDTSIDGFKYVGINLTEQQFEDLRDLNMLITCNDNRKNIPVFNTMLVLKTLGLLPPEMVCDTCNDNPDSNSYEDIYNSLQRKFGKVIE